MASADTVDLHEVNVVAPASVVRVLGNGGLAFDSRSLRLVPRTLGEADPMQFIKTLPGVAAVSDISTGVMLDGMGYAQTGYRLNGAAALFPYHFGGIFSTFNPVLFPKATLHKSVRDHNAPDYLGGYVDISSGRSLPEKIGVSLNVGMLASTLSVRAPVSRNLTVAASGRLCYLNLLYGPLLARSSNDIDYDFHDMDFHAAYSPGPADSFEATFHRNSDRLSYGDTDYGLLTRLRWSSNIAGVSWESRHAGYSMNNRLYWSDFRSTLSVGFTQMGITALSSFGQGGAEGTVDFLKGKALSAGAGYTAHVYRSEPQWISSFGVSGLAEGVRSVDIGALGELRGHVTWTAGPFEAEGAAVAGYYRGPDAYSHVAVDPSVTLRAGVGRSLTVTLQCASATQYIHQVGLSEIGMASNFKLLSSEDVPPQRQWSFSGAVTGRPWSGVSATAELYWRRVRNQSEYTGAILDLLSGTYRAEDHVWSCDGYSTGVNLMANYAVPGPLSATVSYGWCRARRHDPATGETFTASSEIEHSLNVSAAYRIGRSWEVTAAFALSSGRPYTPATAVYLVGERVMLEYGPRNSARMPAYQRLDIGGAWKFSTGRSVRLEHRIDLGLLNALDHRNVEMYAYTVNMSAMIIRRREIVSLFRLIPSLSYTVTF